MRAQTPAAAPVPANLVELRRAIETVLKDTRTPGVGIALVRRDGPEWIAGIGLANVAAGTPATADTLFRIGSVSKGFVSLSILKLAREGKLSLRDPLRTRAPDLQFFNPWEATDPVRIVNVLEHTAGWDDLSLREFAANIYPEVTLQEGLALAPRTRTSRWKPGTRYSYSNAGPPAAAAVIEYVTGQRFEDYVEATWFRPLGMSTASYFDTPEVRSRLATLYHHDGITPFPYWHIILRPAGAINASARDMARYLGFYLHRGAVGGIPLLPEADIDRMERPTSTYAAREGLETGYGLSNYTTVHRRIFHGHNGGVNGGLTQLSYLADGSAGYVFMINSGSGAALGRIDGLVRSYLNRTLPAPPPAPEAPLNPALVAAYAGWYEPIAIRSATSAATLRIAGLGRLSALPTGLGWGGIVGRTRPYVPAGPRQFRLANDGAPTLALIADHSEGTLIEVGGMTYRRVPPGEPWLEAGIAAAFVCLTLSTCAFALIWIPRKYLGHLNAVPGIWVRAFPVIAALGFVLSQVIQLSAGEDSLTRLGNASFWSVGLYVSLLMFAGAAFAGPAAALLAWQTPIRRAVWWHAFAASLVFSGVAAYLIAWGVIGWRPWA